MITVLKHIWTGAYDLLAVCGVGGCFLGLWACGFGLLGTVVSMLTCVEKLHHPVPLQLFVTGEAQMGDTGGKCSHCLG
jgi:hypothetical protein